MAKHNFSIKSREIIVSKEQSITLAQLSAVTSHDDGRVIEGILTKRDIQVATNGFIFLAIKSPDALPTDIQGVNVIDTEGRIAKIEADPRARSFPDVTAIFPTAEPILELAINPRWLIQMLNVVKNNRFVLMRFFGDKLPIEIIGRNDFAENENNVFAVIMPTFKDNATGRPEWLRELEPKKEAPND